MDVQAARPREDDRAARIDANRFVALAVKVREPACKRFENILYAARVVLPGIGGGVFQIEHDSRSARIQHFHDEIRVVGRPRHLVSLVGAPGRKLDAPGIRGGDRRRQVIGNLVRVGFSQREIAAGD